MNDFLIGLEITAIGLLIVFFALILVALITNLLSIIVNRLDKISKKEAEASVIEETSQEDVTPVIIAAISGILGMTINDIKEIRIRPVNPGK